MIGWGVAQWPYILPDEPEGGRRRRAVGHARRRCSSPPCCFVLIVVPGFVLLYTLDQKSLLPDEGVD